MIHPFFRRGRPSVRPFRSAFETGRLVLLVLVCLVSEPAMAASGDVDHEKSSSLSALGWISGTWIGTEGETFIEERWSDFEGDEMIGTFRMLERGQPVFYEFMRLASEPEGIVLRIKHFGADLTAWEEKGESVAFSLKELDHHRALFITHKDGHPERLIYTREEDRLAVVLEKPASESRSRFEFRLSRR